MVIGDGFAGVPPVEPRPADQLAPLLDWLRTGLPVTARTDFPAGTALPDGRLDLCKAQLGVEGVTAIMRVLPPRGPVRHLLLGTDGLGDEGADAAAAGAVRSGVSTLYLGCNGITPAGACRLANRLIASPGVVNSLWLKRNPLGTGGTAGDTGDGDGDGPEAIAEIVRTSADLRTLDLVQTGIDGAAVAVIAEALRTAPGRLERLYLSGNDLSGDVGGAAVASVVGESLVDELYISAARLGDAGALAVAAALRRGAGTERPVRRLSLASNGIGPDALAALVDAAACSGVELLDLGRVKAAGALGAPDNRVDEDAAGRLGAALAARGHRLAVLNLRNTAMTSRGALAILETARRASTPTRFVLGPGIAGRARRELAALATGAATPAVHPDVAAIRSVHRTAPKPNPNPNPATG